MNPIKKALFPVAGLGSRFLPATKANPKEMLPIVDKPLIQYAVEDAIAAGITEIIFITNSDKRAIEDHFDSNVELEMRLEKAGKMELLNIVKNILPQNVSYAYIRQSDPLGLGHAVLCAKSLIGNEPFAVILADDLIYSNKETCLQQMVKVYEQHHSSIIAVEGIPAHESNKYGIIDIAESTNGCHLLRGIVEKPQANLAPSTLAVVGRYLLTPRIFYHLANTEKGASNEIQLTDAIAKLLQEEKIYGYEFEGKRYDCGSKLGYLQATLEYGLRHAEIGKEFAAYLEAR